MGGSEGDEVMGWSRSRRRTRKERISKVGESQLFVRLSYPTPMLVPRYPTGSMPPYTRSLQSSTRPSSPMRSPQIPRAQSSFSFPLSTNADIAALSVPPVSKQALSRRLEGRRANLGKLRVSGGEGGLRGRKGEGGGKIPKSRIRKKKGSPDIHHLQVATLSSRSFSMDDRVLVAAYKPSTLAKRETARVDQECLHQVDELRIPAFFTPVDPSDSTSIAVQISLIRSFSNTGKYKAERIDSNKPSSVATDSPSKGHQPPALSTMAPEHNVPTTSGRGMISPANCS
jgi:hypothetical protein